MKLRENVKKGFIIFSIYLIGTVFVFMATDRVERLNKNYDNRSNFALNLNK